MSSLCRFCGISLWHWCQDWRSDRTINLTPHLQQILLSRRPPDFHPEDLIFMAPQGGAIDDHNFRNRAWKPVLTSLGIPYRKPYTTRDT